jgi:hypothetical protein
MGKDASTIKQEISETRERIGDTVEALGYKTDVGARLKDSVRDRVDTLRESVGDAVETVKSNFNGASDALGTTVNDRVAAAGPGISAAVGRVSDSVAGVSGRAAEVSDALGDRLGHVDVGAQAQRAIGFAQANPIGLALAGLAVGYLTGSLIPVSSIERERLGPIRDSVVDQAQAATHDFVEAGKAVIAETAGSVVGTALASARTHGQDVVDAARSRAEATSI